MLLGPLLQRGKVGRNQHGNELVTVADERGLGYQRVVCQFVFNRMRSNELASRGLQQLFFTIGNEEESIFVNMTNVASMEPAPFVETIGSSLRFLPVARKD